MTVQPRLASTVMLLRDSVRDGIEVFMVRRVVQSEFMPDLYVFPGGSVMPDDRLVEESSDLRVEVAPSAADPEGRTALGNGLRTAAIRELFEEGNVLLAYRDGQIPAAPPEQEALYDSLETSEGMWFEPAEMIARSQRGEVPLAFPTYHQLRDLAAFGSVREALNATITRYVSAHRPMLAQEEGRAFVYLPEEPGTRWRV